MSNLFRIEARESRRRKIYGRIRLWQSSSYKAYLLLTLAAIPVLLGVAWLTPYNEKIRFNEMLLAPGSLVQAQTDGPLHDDLPVRFVTPFPLALPAKTLVRVKIQDPESGARYAVTATALPDLTTGAANAARSTPLIALHLDRNRDQKLAKALREHRKLQGLIVLPRSNILLLLMKFALGAQR